MLKTHLDHIVIAAANLAEGAAYAKSILGVEVPDGGEHLMMGTHNKVMRLGNDVYLEIIAIHPKMLGPTHPRWFGLDDPAVASRDDLRWKVALTDDGRLSAAGFFPLCIQWQIDFHPSEKMADLGCRLEGIELYHPYPKWLQSVLASAGAAHLVNIHPSDSANPVRIDAIISTPGGVATLSSVI